MCSSDLVMKLVQEDFIEKVAHSLIEVKMQNLSLAEMEEHVLLGRIPIILISSYRMYGAKFPHWIVVTGFDEKYVYCHDPYIALDRDKTVLESVNMPILKKDFEKMTKFGKTGQKAAIIIYR